VCSKLLGHLSLEKKMLPYRDDNELKQVPAIIDAIGSGQVVCLTCDAGTPTISDPGFRIVRECRKRGICVESIPGANAITTALAASGLPSDGFLFLGFLPNKSAARTKIFQKYANFEYTLLCYESCHRILNFLEDLECATGGGRIICVAKEMTKLHERFFVGEVSAVRRDVAAVAVRGEYAVVIASEKFRSY
jgi:16S rRNA (cytidine1402-2'-O)-methyltransferase